MTPAPKVLPWMREAPKAPGYYWCKVSGNADPEIVMVRRDKHACGGFVGGRFNVRQWEWSPIDMVDTPFEAALWLHEPITMQPAPPAAEAEAVAAELDDLGRWLDAEVTHSIVCGTLQKLAARLRSLPRANLDVRRMAEAASREIEAVADDIRDELDGDGRSTSGITRLRAIAARLAGKETK